MFRIEMTALSISSSFAFSECDQGSASQDCIEYPETTRAAECPQVFREGITYREPFNFKNLSEFAMLFQWGKGEKTCNFLVDRTSWKVETCVTPSRSCSRSSSRPSKPAALPARRTGTSASWATPPPSTPSPGRTRSSPRRPSSPTTPLPVTGSPPPHPYQTATLLASLRVSWVKVRWDYTFISFRYIYIF